MLYYDDSMTINHYQPSSYNRQYTHEVNNFDAIALHRHDCKFKNWALFMQIDREKMTLILLEKYLKAKALQLLRRSH